MVRSWLEVQDCADAILMVLDHGDPNGIYNVPGNTEASVKEIAARILTQMGMGSYQQGFERPGLDHRYSVNGSKLMRLGWVPQGDFWRDLPTLVEKERALFRW